MIERTTKPNPSPLVITPVRSGLGQQIDAAFYGVLNQSEQQPKK